MPSISLAMIVRDEEAMLPGCLASVSGVVDEVVIVDTGSRDRTVEIARAAGAKLIEEPWADDFAAPRNRAIAQCRGDWVLVLDADERLTRAAGVEVIHAVQVGDFDCGLVPLHTATKIDADLDAVVRGQDRVTEASYLPRLMRRTPDLRYEGIVHENVGQWLFSRGRRAKLLPGVDIVHLGGVPDVRQRRAKSERNIRLLERHSREHPSDVASYGYLAHEYLEAGNRIEARRTADRGWAVLTSGAPALDLAVLRLATARAWIEVQSGEPGAALSTIVKALEIMREHPDLLFIRGCAREMAALASATPSSRRDELEAALTDYRSALACHGTLYLQKFIDGCTGWAAHVRIGTALLLLGELDEALAAFDHAVALNRGAREAQWGRVEALLVRAETLTALREVQAVLDDRPDGWVLAAIAAEAAGQIEAAAKWLSKAQQALPAGFVAPHRRERYHDVLAGLGIHLAQDTDAPGPMGQLALLTRGRYQEAPSARARTLADPLLAAMARRTIARLLEQGRGDAVRALVDQRAESLLPGVVAITRSVVTELSQTKSQAR